MRPTIRILELDCPKAASVFSDVIDLGWVLWPAIPEQGHLGYTEPKSEAPRYELCDLNDLNEYELGNCPFNGLKHYFDLAEDEAPGRYRRGPDLVVKPEPDAPYAAKIYSRDRSRLPRKISSTDRLARYIKDLSYRPVSVGTWGSAHISLWCKSTPDIYGTGSMYGWACFEDLGSLEAFVAQVDGTVVGTKTVEVVFLHTSPKHASPTSTETSREEQNETLSLQGRTEVQEEGTPRIEELDGSGEELRLIEPLDLGESMDLRELMEFTMNLRSSE